jgi:hypothetical protein
MVSTLDTFEFSGFSPVGTPKFPVFAASIRNKEALRSCIAGAYRAIHIYPDVFEWMTRYVETFL